MNQRRAALRRTGLAVVLAVTGAIALSAAQATAVAKSPTAQPEDDFNGDGYADLAVAAPEATVDGKVKAGYVAVLYGTASGLSTTNKAVFTQNTAGVPDTAEGGDTFGSAMTTADLDRDGYTDLVVGVAGEDNPAGADSGMVQVLWGGARGLAGGATLATGDEMYEAVGMRGNLAAGDFDGDGAPELVTVDGFWKMVLTEGPFGRDGAASGGTRAITDDSDPRFMDMDTGDVNGDGLLDLVATAHQGDEYDARYIKVWKGTPDGLAVPEEVLGGNGYALEGGESLALGDFDRDGIDDVVVGRPVDGYDSDLDEPMVRGGRIAYVPGTSDGPDGTKVRYLYQDSAGVPGAAERGDGFGTDVSVADVDGDGYADVSAGVPGEDYDGLEDAGSVVVLRGGENGPTGTGAVSYGQDTAGVPGVAESDDRFGRATRLLDADGDGRSELAVGAPGENTDAGSVWVFRSTSAGVTATGAITFGHGTLGTVATGARLGSGFTY
ncbi:MULTISPECIES: FG-GAP-like repeat-containing protein [unclassified Streptomyces]|uniref:FG-GAP-like repeat-containing protein n=1 Tax=unclassified Streptomyces TaxID=2593676 RepID=UPI000938FFA8|nr:FG-GAP-like repeat-containing protein [Streptomyces sp. TSRI0107]OKJ90555.1 integrin [Streptomyces sp. TSRI0107]